MCRSAEIDEYAFCSGLDVWQLPSQDSDAQSRIRSVIYLIKRAVLRPKYATSRTDRFSLDIRPLRELIQLYCNRDTSDCRDKVYALLGMSSDDCIPASLSPDYKIPWNDLFRRLVEFLIGDQTSIETWVDREVAVIDGKGCILGKVTSVNGDGQKVDIVSNGPSREFGLEGEWTLQESAKTVRAGDLLCRLHGAPTYTITRPCKDHFSVILISVTPPKNTSPESARSERREPTAPSFRTTFALFGTGRVHRWIRKTKKSMNHCPRAKLMSIRAGLWNFMWSRRTDCGTQQ